MAITAFRDMKPSSQLIFSAFIVLCSFLISMVLALVAAIPIFGMEAAMGLMSVNDMSNQETIKLLKFVQVIQSIGLFIVPAVVLAHLFSGKYINYLFLDRKFSGASFLLVILTVLFAGPFVNLMSQLNSAMVLPDWMKALEDWMRETEESAESLTKAFLNVNTIGGLTFNLFMIAMLPAIGEELLFRGVIQRLFTKLFKNHHWGIWVTAILFSALHMQFYGFVPRMFLGALFGYMLVWSGSMWVPVLAHLVNNASAVLFMFLIDQGQIGTDMETIGSEQGTYYWAGISAMLVLVFMVMLKKENKEKQLVLTGSE